MRTQGRLSDDGNPFEPGQFQWLVDPRGYRLARRAYVLDSGPFDEPDSAPRTGSGPVLVYAKGVAPSRKSRPRYYEPLAVPELFRAFARVPPNPDSILDFANRFGFLGLHVFLPDWDQPDPAGGFRDMYGEPLAAWVRQIAAMQSAIAAWEALCFGTDAELRRWCMQGDERDRPLMGLCRALDLEVGLASHWFLVTRSDAGEPVDVHCFEALDISRREAAADGLVEVANGYLERHCAVRLSPRGRIGGAYRLHLTSRTLLGACWWQFAQWITGQSDYQPCRVCGRVMEISTGGYGSRSDRRYCSPRCRVKDFRRRVKARRLRAEGKTAQQIARLMRVTKNEVDGWLGKPK